MKEAFDLLKQEKVQLKQTKVQSKLEQVRVFCLFVC